MITLASDFGTPYPAAMKGVIAQRSDARLVDVAHDFPRQDVRTAAFWLREVLPYFPPAVHLVVVDPGVGTNRAAIVVRAGEHAIVAPDNGVAIPTARRLADEFELFEIEYDEDSLPSATFHGRDVFAPATAAIHEVGVESVERLDRLEPTTKFVDLRFPAPEIGDQQVSGEVLVVDDFGNAITNIPGAVLDPVMDETVTVNGETAPTAPTFAAVSAGQRLLTVGSHGNVELAVNQGRGDEAFDVGVGDPIQIELP